MYQDQPWIQWAGWGAAATPGTVSILKFSAGLTAKCQYEIDLLDWTLNSRAGKGHWCAACKYYILYNYYIKYIICLADDSKGVKHNMLRVYFCIRLPCYGKQDMNQKQIKNSCTWSKQCLNLKVNTLKQNYNDFWFSSAGRVLGIFFLCKSVLKITDTVLHLVNNPFSLPVKQTGSWEQQIIYVREAVIVGNVSASLVQKR